jgi:hypothetical protein
MNRGFKTKNYQLAMVISRKRDPQREKQMNGITKLFSHRLVKILFQQKSSKLDQW